MSQEPTIKAAESVARARWQTPFPGFASGHDARTSDNALLALVYGSMAHATDHEWLNAGRCLIDKTYVEILWQVQGLGNMRTCRPEQISASLDNFIQGTLRHRWRDLSALSPAMRNELTVDWINGIAQTCFGSLHSELAASRLLFHLCPMLPVFNLSRGHLLALEQLGHRSTDDSYAAYARSAAAAYRELAPILRLLPEPIPEFGSPAQQTLIRQLLDESDWWPRRVFDEVLRQSVPGTQARQQRMLACDDAGRLVA